MERILVRTTVKVFFKRGRGTSRLLPQNESGVQNWRGKVNRTVLEEEVLV